MDPEKEERIRADCQRRWETEPSLRKLFGCMTHDPNSDQWKEKLARFTRAEIKCQLDQSRSTSPAFRPNDAVDDSVGRTLRNKNVVYYAD